MKNPTAGDAAGTSLLSAAGGSSVQVHQDYQGVALQMGPGPGPGPVQRDSSSCTSTLTQWSTLTLAESQQGAQLVRLKEFVLIDDEDDGDMSLREKTVSDVSAADGQAAQLVCGRVASSSSSSSSDSSDSLNEEKEKEEEPATEALTPPRVKEEQAERRCFCSCSIF